MTLRLPRKNKIAQDAPKSHFTTEDGQIYEIPLEGSLGLMALGYEGLMAWRQKKLEYIHQKKKSGDRVSKSL